MGVGRHQAGKEGGLLVIAGLLAMAGVDWIRSHMGPPVRLEGNSQGEARMTSAQ